MLAKIHILVFGIYDTVLEGACQHFGGDHVSNFSAVTTYKNTCVITHNNITRPRSFYSLSIHAFPLAVIAG